MRVYVYVCLCVCVPVCLCACAPVCVVLVSAPRPLTAPRVPPRFPALFLLPSPWQVEGFTQEISLMRKKVQRLELKAYGRRLPLQADGQIQPDEAAKAGASAKVQYGARALRVMQARVAALEKNLLELE